MDDNRQIEENNAWDKLRKWETLVDDRIRKMIGDGNMSGNPLAGKPLQLEDESLTPEDQRLSYRIMKSNDVVPPWMALRFTLVEYQEKLMRRLRLHVREYRQQMKKAEELGSFVKEREAEALWQQALRLLAKEVDSYNSEILNYNLTIPAQIPQMIPLNLNDEVQKVLKQL